ncbi:RagB/SusD family nutrient uptake outer membrane protein [Agriterribacter sp.]|uniref:RagB/SusD family nutrient uptake outer membrane protein n=1 Tax=Agriterribacter sp. TaxID=2821509 RepID=UPI002BD80E03|nr:RagB/SusD family nutrient uptake outer membrane protein [Agriterribacter sp.]HTN05990.1 RagB/SusD family nutrient uptake outer membrane protein [Agriterribacter sp.]
MKNSLTITFLLATLCILSSCKKYLNEKPDAGLAIPQSLKDLQAMLDNSDFMNFKTPCLDEGSSDDYYLPTSVYQSLSSFERNIYTWNYKGESTYPNDWSFIYDAVNISNIILEAVENIPFDATNSEEWSNVKGSALFFRAQSFLRAAFIFARAYDENTSTSDYGIPLRLSSDYLISSIRANNEETYNQIINDLRNAINLLPVTAKHVMRPSKTAAYALMARSYLAMRQYNEAFKYADSALQLNSNLVDYNDLNVADLIPFTQFNKEVLFSSVIAYYTVTNIVPGLAIVDSTLYNSYDLNDLRRDAFFIDFGDGPVFKGTYDGSFGYLFNGIATDEVLLTRAECYARLGNKDMALADLNTLLTKRFANGSFVPVEASDTNAALALILSERRKELVFRGLRWIDIKRLNKEGANIVLNRKIDSQSYTLLPDSKKYAIALPIDVIQLAGMQQNDY